MQYITPTDKIDQSIVLKYTHAGVDKILNKLACMQIINSNHYPKSVIYIYTTNFLLCIYGFTVASDKHCIS